VVTADKVRFNVAATTYVDDFFQPLVAAQKVSNETAIQLMATVNGLIRSFRNRGFFFMLVGILLLMGLSYWVRIFFSRAIKYLRTATKTVNQGDFETHIEPVRSSGDVNELIDDFNQMVSRLAITTVKKEKLEASEERLKRSNEKLLAEMAERQRAKAQRREMESQLQRAQKMQALGNLASGVAHDLKNILSGLVS
jgi:C4-dicarboxylate-specific signal transduction histidine kinase